MRRVILALLAFTFLCIPAEARLRGGVAQPIVIPLLRDLTINEGMFTRSKQGGVPLDNLVYVGGILDHYKIKQTAGPGGNSYWQTACDSAVTGGANGYNTIPSASYVSVPDHCQIATPTTVIGYPGTNYTVTGITASLAPGSNGHGLLTVTAMGTTGPMGIQPGQVMQGGTVSQHNIILPIGTDGTSGTGGTGVGAIGTYATSISETVSNITSTNDVICGGNGAAYFVKAIANDTAGNDTITATLPNYINTVTQLSAPTSWIGGVSAVTTDGATCPSGYTASTFGVGAKLTMYAFGYAQSPQPTATSDNNNMGYPMSGSSGGCTSGSNCNDFIEFSVQAFADAGETIPSNVVTLKINAIVDAVNYSPAFPLGGSVTSTLVFGSCTVSAGACTAAHTNTMQVWVNALLNTSSAGGPGGVSTSDGKVLISTGAIGVSPNPGNICCTQQLSNTINPINYANARGLATTNANPAPATTNVYDIGVWEDACRATGSVLVAGTSTKPEVDACDTSAGGNIGLTMLEHFTISSSQTLATACATTNALTGTAGWGLVGLRFGGDQRDQFARPIGLDIGSFCNIWVTNPVFTYTSTFGSDGVMLSNLAGNGEEAMLFRGNGNHLFVDEAAWFNPAQCWGDGSSSVANASTDVNFNDWWCQGANNNSALGTYSGMTSNDGIMLRPQQYPGGHIHVDYWQLNNNSNPVNETWNRTILMDAGGGMITQGMYFGNCVKGLVPEGFQMKGIIFEGNSLTVVKNGCADGVTTRPWQIEDITAVVAYSGEYAIGTVSGDKLTITALSPSDYPNAVVVGRPVSGAGIVTNPAPTVQAFGSTACNSGMATTGTGGTGTYCLSHSSSATPGSSAQLTIGNIVYNTSNPVIQELTFVSLPHDGDTFEIGIGCAATSLTYGSCDVPTPQQRIVLTFRNTPVAVTDIQIGGTTNATLQNLATAIGYTVALGTCNGMTPTALSAYLDSQSVALGAPKQFHLCANPVPPGTTGIGIYSSLSPRDYIYQSFCANAGAGSCVVSGGGNRITAQFPNFQNLATAYGAALSSVGNGTKGSPNLNASGANSGWNATCGSSFFWCGSSVYSNNFLWDAIVATFPSYWTNTTAAAGLSNFTVTNNFMGANDGACTGGCTQTTTGIFTGDGTVSAQRQLEATPSSTQVTWTPGQICTYYLAPINPQSGGPLDLGGGNWIGAVNSSNQWNDASGRTPCDRVQTSGSLPYLN